MADYGADHWRWKYGIMKGHEKGKRPVELFYDPQEQREVLQTFRNMLEAATRDGGRKRAAGLKVNWKEDTGHEAAMYRHLAKWKTDPKGRDEDSGAHHLIAVAWRALAIAYQETR